MKGIQNGWEASPFSDGCRHNFLVWTVPSVYSYHAYHLNFYYTAMVLNFEGEMVSDESIKLSWEHLQISEITKYKVRYTLLDQQENESIEYSATLSATYDNLLIGCLLTGKEYLFAIAALAEVDGDVIVGIPTNFSNSTATQYDGKMIEPLP